MPEWAAVHERREKVHSEALAVKWTLPEEGWLKANADGALSKLEDRRGGGVVLRDHEGPFRLRGGAACIFPGVAEPELGEVLAARNAVQMAAQAGASRVHVELDNKGVVAMLTDKAPNLSAVGLIIEDIKKTPLSFVEFRATWVRRSGKKGAHVLAREGVHLDADRFWFLQPPDCILHVLSDEIPGVGA